MKLNTKRTVLAGFAFLSICAFWQMYNSVIPLILTNTFRLNEAWFGVIMAAGIMIVAVFVAAFVAASLVTMLGVKHGDTKILKKPGRTPLRREME